MKTPGLSRCQSLARPGSLTVTATTTRLIPSQPGACPMTGRPATFRPGGALGHLYRPDGAQGQNILARCHAELEPPVGPMRDRAGIPARPGPPSANSPPIPPPNRIISAMQAAEPRTFEPCGAGIPARPGTANPRPVPSPNRITSANQAASTETSEPVAGGAVRRCPPCSPRRCGRLPPACRRCCAGAV